MSNENNYDSPISRILMLSDGKSVNKTYIEVILKEDIFVFCKNKIDQKFQLKPFKTLYEANNNFWLQDKNWEYFFTKDTLDKLKEKNIIEPAVLEVEDTEKTKNDSQPKSAVDQGFGDDYNAIADMTNTEQVKYLNDIKTKLDDLVSKKTRDKSTVTNVMVNTTRDAVMINHLALKNAFELEDAEAKQTTRTLVFHTQEMVKSYAQLISQDIFDNELMNQLVEKSNGTIVQHMTRVYLNGISFLAFYNKFVSNRASIVTMRRSLNIKYRQYYHNLLQYVSIDDIVLERVFQNGMLTISPDLFVKWAVGFLIHDIGKADAVEYHESEASYDRDIVIKHVKLGFNAVVNKTNYPKEASLITGYHHEYYGNPDGYGYFREYFENYKKSNPQVRPEYCMTFDMESMLDCHALSYFPAKVLEIVDVYDSLTDPNRVYRKALSSEEALVTIREEFIRKKLKIDPLLFELFVIFIQRSKNT